MMMDMDTEVAMIMDKASDTSSTDEVMCPTESTDSAGYVRNLNFDLSNLKQDPENDNIDLGTEPSSSHTHTELKDFVKPEYPYSQTGSADTDIIDTIDSVVCFVNKDAKVTPAAVLQYVLDVNQPFDTVISCADGRIGAHRLVLASASPYIGDMFCSQDHRLGEIAVLVLPDVRVAIMKLMLSFCYTGKIYFPKEDEKEVIDTMRLLLLGEFATLTIKEITVKREEPHSSSDCVNDAVQQEGESVSTAPVVSSNLETDDDRQEVDPSDVFSNEDEEDSDSDSDSHKSDTRHTTTTHQIQSDKNHLKNASRSYTYLIVPAEPGTTFRKKLQCCHCPGAFKTTETLNTHLENNHSIELESRKVDKTELSILLNCGRCKTKHSQISSANQCLSNRASTRCFICLEIVKHKKFDLHMKKSHGGDKKNGMQIVKCRWCDAGIMLREPIENRIVAGHCFSLHFPKGGNSSNSRRESIEVAKPSRNPKAEITITTPARNILTPSLSQSQSKPKPVPAILALLQKASQKRKSAPVTITESDQNKAPSKRLRLEDKQGRPQVARRTGKPVGRQVNLNALSTGVPSFQSKGKSKTVTFDVTKLPEIFVHFKYDKTFILDYVESSNDSREETVGLDKMCEIYESDVNSRLYRLEKNTQRCALPCL